MPVQKSDKLFTMPQPYYGAAAEKSGAPSFRPESAGAMEPPTAHKNRAVLVMLGLGLLVLLAIAGWMVYINYKPVNLPTATNTVPRIIAPTTPTAPVVVTPVAPIPPVVTTPTVVEPVTPIEPTVPVSIVTADETRLLADLTMIDTDSDGLTDAEELLLGTKVDTADSDGDTYNDGTELLNLYNPLAKEPASLAFSGVTSTYVNPVFGYSILYPKSWVAKAVDATNSEVMFSSAVGENVSVQTFENPQSLNVLTRYATQNPTDAAKVSTMTTKSNVTVLRSIDGFHVFAASGTNIVELTYSVGMKDDVSYPHLFEVMVQGLVSTNQ